MADRPAWMHDANPHIVTIRYTNHRGETADRRIVPRALLWGQTEWHPEEQWLLEAFDLERKAYRHFAMANVHEWRVDKRGR